MNKLILSLLFLLVLASCGKPMRIQGRLAFRDNSGCGSAVPAQEITWSACHAFKQSFSPSTGAEYTSNRQEIDALRPLKVQVELRAIQGNSTGEAISFEECGKLTVQTDANGIFNILLPDCGDSERPFIILGTVYLQYKINRSEPAGSGTIRAFWREDRASELFSDFRGSSLISQTPAFTTDEGYRFAIPTLTFIARVNSAETTENLSDGTEVNVYNLGTKVLSATGTDNRFGYFNQMLTGYVNAVRLNEKLYTEMSSREDFFTRMYPIPPTYPESSIRFGRTYSVFFDNDWAAASTGWMNLYRPDVTQFSMDANGDGIADGSAPIAGLLSDTSVVSHEFGHSVQGAFSPLNFGHDYDFGSKMMASDGTIYDWGHGGWQNQDFGSAVTEGSANTIGQFLLNRCSNWFNSGSRRPTGGPNPFPPSTITADQGFDDDIPYRAPGFHNTRWHLVNNQGIAEGSSQWNSRIAKVAQLEALATSVGHGRVLSNQEMRFDELGCDLLDSNTSVSHVPATLTTQRYVRNYTFLASEYLYGDTSAIPAASTYTGNPVAETAQISFVQYISALDTYTDGFTLTGAGAFGHDYNRDRVSIDGPMSGQSLLQFMIDRSWITRAQAQNLLRTNLMEELR